MRTFSRPFFLFFSATLALLCFAKGTARCDEGAKAASAPPVKALTGDATITFGTETSTACSGTTCDSGSCFCDTYTGSLTLTQIGKVSLALDITYNGTNTTNSGGGNGVCFVFSGFGTLNGKTGSTSFSLTGGSACNNFDLGKGALITNAGFYINPASGTGTLTGAAGAGNIVVTRDFTNNASFVHIDGNFQK